MSQPELLGPPLKPGRYIKVSIFLKKKVGITDEYFHAYWLHNHTHNFLKTKAFQTLVRKYSQSHFTKELSELNAQIMGNMPMLEYDGVAEFWFESFEDWKKLWADEEFLATLAGDNEHFVQQPLPMMAGYDYLYQDNTRETGD